jgi:hypothetical protein
LHGLGVEEFLSRSLAVEAQCIRLEGLNLLAQRFGASTVELDSAVGTRLAF